MHSWSITLLLAATLFQSSAAEPRLLTTSGPLDAETAGTILPHEHLFTDLRGPEIPGYGQADANDVVRVIKPLLLEAKHSGVSTLVECTTIGVGRNLPIIARLARESGLHIVVPTGVYGRAHFAPKKFAAMSEDDLTRWMIDEITVGIEDSGIRAGFIKTAASDDELKPLEEKFLRASARAALATGVAIASHTTKGDVAIRQADLLHQLGLPLHRFIWVHAQAESNLDHHKSLAARGVYIELDSVGASDSENAKILGIVQTLKSAGHLDQLLLSHDAGWYNPGQPNGGSQRGFTALLTSFLPRLKQAGFSDDELRGLTSSNPFNAFALRK